MKTHPTRLAAACLLVLLSFAAPLRADEGNFDRWYVLMFAGQRAGHVHRSQSTEKGQITTTEEMNLSIRRDTVVVEAEQRMSFTETTDGKPIEASLTLRMAQQPMSMKFVFHDAGVDVTRSVGGSQSKNTVPMPDGPYMTPAESLRYQVAQAEQGEKKIEMAVLDISTGTLGVMDVTMTHAGEEKIEVMGKTVLAEAWDTEMAAAPGLVLRDYMDGDGQMLRSTTSLGMFDVDIIAADKELALSSYDAPELMANTFVEPEGDLPNPRQLRRAVYRLTLPDNFEDDLLRAGYQRVTWADERTALVVQDLDEPVNPTDDEAKDGHLAATSMLDHADESVRKLVTDALGDDAAQLSQPEKAERLRQFVHRYVASKNLSVGFATATEVAMTAEGDCTEHAVLLAAMLRAAEIPSRTVTGLIYVGEFAGATNIFGYHMWTQAWLAPQDNGRMLGHRWVDLDATLDQPFDAAHIALSSSAMEDGAFFNDIITLVPLLSNLKIEVVEAK